MPYIDDDHRQLIDEYVNALDDRLRMLGDKPGCLNYVISRLVGAAWLRAKCYASIATLSGVLTNVSQEFYRRVASAYEDAAINKNGDINEYEVHE